MAQNICYICRFSQLWEGLDPTMKSSPPITTLNQSNLSLFRSKRERKVKLGEEEGERDSIDDPFLMDLDNRHTKSELSIPYMDASLPPTPKVK